MRDGVIKLLSRNRAAKEILAPLLNDAAKEWTIPMLASEPNASTRRKNIETYSKYLATELKLGNTDKWKMAIAQTELIKDDSVRTVFNLSLLSILTSKTLTSGMSHKSMEAVIPLYYESVGKPQFLFSRSTLSKLLTMHYLSGTEHKFREYASGIAPKSWTKFHQVYHREIIAGNRILPPGNR